MPFWNHFCKLLGYDNASIDDSVMGNRITEVDMTEGQVIEFANEIGRCMAVAVTNSGQLLFLYRTTGENNEFSDSYTLHWSNTSRPWELRSGNRVYSFQLPRSIMELWLENSTNDLELKKRAINCKAGFLSSMIVYYSNQYLPTAKMISIDKYDLERARQNL